jgi:hypothetical protein
LGEWSTDWGCIHINKLHGHIFLYCIIYFGKDQSLVGFLDIIHATKTIKQNYLRVLKISLDRSWVVYGFITWKSDLLWL